MAELVFSGYPPNCPLPEAVLAEGAAFRITQHDPPSEEDFLSPFEIGEQPKSKPTANQRCRARSLSIYRKLEDARQHLEMYNHGEGFIAAGKRSRHNLAFSASIG